MGEVSLKSRMTHAYDDYYADANPEWRRLGAIAKVQNIMALCGDLPHRSIVEIGAGEGSILKRLSDSGFGERLYGLEISPSAIAAIKGKAIANLVECGLFDGCHIPYPDGGFNLAVLSHVVEHVEHPRQLLYEAARVATYVFVEVPLEDTLRLPRDFVPDSVGHINFYSLGTFRRLVQSCGFRMLDQITTNPAKEAYIYRLGRKGVAAYWMKQAFLRVSPGIASRLFTYHAALVCTKLPTGAE